MKEKLVVIKSIGTIAELGGISGPIINPCRVDINTIVRMITSHRAVYEVNPNNKSEMVKLNIHNGMENNFPEVKSSKVEVKPAEIAKKAADPTPEVRKAIEKAEDAKAEASLTGDFKKA